ncbi:hypothetical protein GPAL_0527 [Glaciecola pallidula DSM 14239 = ACAM 615]|uniref:Uncharacterized protein n=2 Tax=Brumicola TaxID=3160924 RepID=K6ZAN5_9ALTE|nr:hypothetical protein GPAL_0527 [Glaciecola pallidula DSM 14239 = ACAM 615]
MGKGFTDLVYLVKNIEKDENSRKFLDHCLKLKVNAKKMKSATGEELSVDQNLSARVGAINSYRTAFEKEELELKKEAERLKAIDNEKLAIKAKKRARLIEQERKKAQEAKKAQYLKRFCDFPEFCIKGIKRGSDAAKVLLRLRNNDANEEDFFWLEEKGFTNDLTTQALHAFYLKRGKIHLAKWKKDNAPWGLVNAIADYRRSKSSQEILGEIQSNYPFTFSKGNKQLNSALLTTSGGVYRDLFRYTESLKLGTEAHILNPSNYRPCTLVGASNILLGDMNEGHSWYQKAIERGFKPESYDKELRSIYMSCSKQIKEKLKRSLLAIGQNHSWLTN